VKLSKPKGSGLSLTKDFKDSLYPVDNLTSHEQTVADEIAYSMKHKLVDCPIGLYIWKVCKEYGIKDHKKIAKHLGSRNKYRR